MLIIAHRGASHDAPENTLAAVRLAWAQGADALEIDVHLTRDGRLAVIHDPDTRRTAGVERVVAATSLAELQTLDVGSWKGATFAGERIPALEDVLALVPAGKRVFVEIKGGPGVADELRRCVEAALKTKTLQPAQVAIIAFDLAAARAAKQVLPALEVCWLADSGAEAPRPTLAALVETALAAGLDGIDVDAGWTLTRASVAAARAAGCAVYVWTVDDVTAARHLKSAGVDGLTTNRPGWLRAQLAGAGRERPA